MLAAMTSARQPSRSRAHLRRRRRLRRPRRGDQARGGRRARLPGRRARQRRRRHLAGQHLPRRRLRRARRSSTRSPSRRTRDWSRSFSPQPEIQAYIQRVAERVRGARPAPLRHRRGGGPLGRRGAACGRSVRRPGELTADVVVAAAGALSEPALPDIDGIDSFAGEIFHSARWDHDYDLTGKRVAVIGTGASAIQIVPEIAEQVAHLDVYQRTAPWVMPAQRPRLHRRRSSSRSSTCPRVQRAYRTGDLLGPRDASCPAFVGRPAARGCRAKQARADEHRARASPTRRCARRSPRTYADRLQADPDLQRLVPRARPRRRRPGHRPHREDHPGAASSPRTAPSARSTC